MNVAGYRSKVIALIIGSVFVAVLFLMGNNTGSIEGVAPVDNEPHYAITAVSKLCNALPGHALPAIAATANPACADDATLGGPRTITTTFTIPEGQMNFSAFNTFESTKVEITPGCNVDTDNDGIEDDRVYSAASGLSPTSNDGIDNDNDGLIDGPGFGTDTDNECLAPGDLVGGMRSDTDLALFNGTCTSDVSVDFAFYNVALPDNPDDPRQSTNIVSPNNEGTADRIRPLMNDGDGDGLANADSPGILNYPDWFLDLFDPDWRPLYPDESGPQEGPGADPTPPHNGALKPVIPIALYGAITDVAGTATPLYFAQFADGALGDTAFTDPNHYFNVAQTGMGQLNMSVLTDTTVAVASSSTISDFCSELIARTMLLGTTGNGMKRAINPSVAGTAFTKYWTPSQRDTDNDSFENQIDTCPMVANVDNIRTLGGVDDDSDTSTDEDLLDGIDNDSDTLIDEDGIGDPDLDRIDTACDVNPGINDGINVDGDVDASVFGFQNAQDNCPQVANNSQSESENRTTVAAADGGPKSDGIGDACDSEAGVLNVVQNGYAPGVNIAMSDTVANGHYHLTTVVEPYCYGGVDADGDGYCAGDQEAGMDGNPTRHKAWGGSLVDLTAADRDGDGYSDYVESYLGTDPTKACSYSNTVGDENSSKGTGGLGSTSPLAVDAWPSDLNDSGTANMQDVIFAYVTSLFPTGLNQNAVPPLNRVDLNADGFVNMQDVILGFVAKLAPTGLNKACTLETQQ